ncbi:MAG TPA: S41 family peptidase [Thermoanaerobaculia bacterium]|jgi:C-terminal processing protease CtpA/Prc
MKRTLASLLLLCLFAASTASAQTDRDIPIDAATREKVLNYVLEQLEAEYVYPDMAKSVVTTMRERLRRGDYDQMNSAVKFGMRLTEELRALTNDQHIGVRYFPAPVEQAATTKPEPKPQSEEQRRAEQLRAVNWGNHSLPRVERLPGNIGYLQVDGFADPETAGETLAAAMRFIADTEALIVDLRHNQGGRPEMVALMTSYFLDAKKVHLTDVYCRVPISGLCSRNDETRAFWSLADLPGRRYAGPLYILTSRMTFSAGEEFAYNLQALRRATLIGERTGGGANPGTLTTFFKDWQVFVPQAHAVSAITKGTWDQVGVTPDVSAPADRALTLAHLDALRKTLPRLTDAWQREEVQEAIARLEKETK